MREIIIIGAGGHAVSIAEAVISNGDKILYFVDKYKYKQTILGYEVCKSIKKHKGIINIIIALGDNYQRQQVYLLLNKLYSNINFPAIIHETAVVSKFSKIGKGSVVLQNAVVGSNSIIGSFCIINTSASIDHDSKMSNFSSLAPASVTGGNVKIGMRSALCINATIKHDVIINKDVVIGANSYVDKEVKSNLIVFGTPAKIIKKRRIGDSYL